MFGKLGSLLSFRGHLIGRQGATRKRNSERQPQDVAAAVVEELEVRALLTTGPQQLLYAEPGPIMLQPGQPVPISSSAVVGTYDAEYAQLAATLAAQLTSTGTTEDRYFSTSIAPQSGTPILPQTDQTLDVIRADVYYADSFFSQYNGGQNGGINGVSVVILDSGIDRDHAFFGPDANNDGIADRIVYSYDFGGNDDADASDFDGHGTNVSGIVGSSNGTYGGVANGVNIIHLKVFPDLASQGATSFDIEQGLQWVVANAATYNIVAINMSLGGGNFSAPTPGVPWTDEFAALDSLGILNIAAAGNSFFSFNSQQGVGLPAADPNVIAVSASWDANEGAIAWGDGAVDFSTAPDRVASFSQRHATLTAVLAPGPFSTNAGLNGGTVTMGGTSQASPHVAGAAALAQQIALDLGGRRLTQTEFRTILATTGPAINDGDDEDDNVNNTGATWHRLDLMDMALAVQSMFAPPTISPIADVTINEDSSTGPLQFTISDVRVSPNALTVTATSDNQSLIPDGNIVLGGTGANRTVNVSPRADLSGTATITVSVSNGFQTGTETFLVTVVAQPDPLPSPGETPDTIVIPNVTPTPIDDATVTTSDILVAGLDSYLFDANVFVNLSHPANGELQLKLISPSGIEVMLSSDNGGANGDVFTGTTFDDQAGQPITDATFVDGNVVPFIIPEGALAQLRGEDPNGTWTLEITDTTAGNIGTLVDWSLELSTLAAEPPLQTTTIQRLIPRTIPADSTREYTITFTDQDPYLWNMDLNLDLEFPTNEDLDIYLISPKGTLVTISSGNGGLFADVFAGTNFSDSNGIPVTDEAYVSGVASPLLIPEGALAQFLGENSNGVWTLRIVNRNLTTDATLNNWSLDLTTIFINDPPTLGTVLNPNPIYEDAGQQVINLFGISAGPLETSQPVSVTVVSDNPGLIPTPTVNYTSANNFGSLVYSPEPNQSGIANFTITVTDGGLDDDLQTTGDNSSITRIITVIVLPVNDTPTLNSIVPVTPILEDAPEQFITLTGISAGGGESQLLQITAVSSNAGLIPNPVITYTQGSSTADMVYQPNANAHGTTNITVTLTDPGLDGNFATTNDNLTVVRNFTVVVTSVNDAPTINPVALSQPLVEDGPTQVIGLSGITAGGGEQQPLRITTISNNPVLIEAVSVSYISGNNFGALNFRPKLNQFGSAIIDITVEDAGFDGNFNTAGDNASTTISFTVTVLPGNDPPLFDNIPQPAAILEDALTQTINLFGINAGPSESQILEFTVFSSNELVIPVPTVFYTSPDTTGFIQYAPAPNAHGSSVISVLLTDGGLDNDISTTNDNATLLRQFLVVVQPVNDNPTMDAIPNPAAIPEDSGMQTVNLTGITAGGGETQPIQITVLSGNPALIPTPTLDYTSGNSTGTLTYTPVANANGTALITLEIVDGGLDGNLATTVDNGLTIRTFTVTVNSVNDAPAFDALSPNPLNVAEEAGPQQITINGITAGPNETQNLQFSVSSNNPTLILTPSVSHTNGQTTGTLNFTVAAGQFGSATLLVTVTDPGLDGNFVTTGDNATYTRTLDVNVAPVNDDPTLNALGDLTLSEDPGLQTINLSGITSGPANEFVQPLSITATSSNLALISNPFVNYSSPNTTGSLQLLPLANQTGTTTITVTVTDGGLDNNLVTTGDNGTFVRTFTITITPVNDAPVITPIVDPAPILEDAGQQIVSLVGIGAGGGENQPLRITAVSSDTSIIPNPTVDYVSPGVSAQLIYTPVANANTQSGVVTITVFITDGGLDNDLDTPGDNSTTQTTFNVVVQPVNDAPVFDNVNNIGPLPEDLPSFPLQFTGIGAGGGETQNLAVTVTSSNTALIPNPVVTYPNGSDVAAALFTPVANQSGTTTITVSVMDGGADNNLATTGDNLTTTKTFTITLFPVNDAPTMNALASNLSIDEDAAQQTISLSGITAGGGETQPLRLTVVSSDPSIIPNPVVNYTSPNTTGSVQFQPLTDASGTVDLIFTLMDGGLDGDLNTTGDNNLIIRTVQVQVAEQPEAPKVTLDSSSAISSKGAETIISPNALLTDADNDNFIGGKITVAITSGATLSDVLSIKSSGAGNSKITVGKHGELKVGKNIVGQVTGGTNGVPLEIEFLADVTPNFAQLIMQLVSFKSKAKDRGLRTITFTATDPDGHTSDPKQRFVSVS